MLGDFLNINPFAGLIVFARVGTVIAFLPGFSTAWVSMRVRLVMALALTLLVTPALVGTLPPMPATPAALGLLLARESAVGLFLGSVALIAFAALHTTGTFAAYLSSFASALIQDPVADQQSSTISGFFTALGLVLIFVTNLHSLMLRAIVASYDLFIPGALPPFDDFCSFVTHTVAESFALGVQLAAPFLVVSLVYNVGLGLLGRLIPQLPVFFFGLPLQLALQILVMMLTISGIMLIFLEHFADMLAGFGSR